MNVPSYIGLTQEDATSSLEKKGLKVEIAYSTSGAYNKGDVIKQNPVGGSEVPKGSTVVLTINDPDKAASGKIIRQQEPGQSGYAERNCRSRVIIMAAVWKLY